MSRRSLIISLAILGCVLLGLGVAIAFLYSGVDTGSEKSSEDALPIVLTAVPSDAAVLACGTVGELAGSDIPVLEPLKRCQMSVSLHYSGKLMKLYVADVHKADDDQVKAAAAHLTSNGISCGQASGLLIYSESPALVKSSLRHLENEVSIVDASGFRESFESVKGSPVLLMSNLHARRLVAAVGASGLTGYSSFLERTSDWIVLEYIGKNTLEFSGRVIFEGEPDEFFTVFEKCKPGVAEFAQCLPSYTLYAISIPVENQETYTEAYEPFADSRQALKGMKAKQNALGKSGLTPEEFFRRLQVKEIASAFFVLRSNVEKVNLLRVESRDPELIFAGTSVKSFRGYVPVVHDWKYQSYVSSVYGKMFALKKEECFTYIDGWLVVGSREAVDEFVSRNALNYTLHEYLADAGQKGILSDPALAVAYFSMTEAPDRLPKYISKPAIEWLKTYIGEADCAPAVMSIGRQGEDITLSARVVGTDLEKTEAPVHDRDTVVVVPQGPFKVKNSHTGKVNTFYQNAHNSLCLMDENGKNLWGVPFPHKICGTATNIDYYANGKLQIIFGAGSSIYIIDRLGRYLGGFPVDLGKEIAVGPALYDFAGAGKYNIIVLHKDNTLEMYNLKGKRPASWKTISREGETIKALPERLLVEGRNYWIVRTSIQTLIYPFNGGTPVTSFTGNSMIRPDSNVELQEDGTVKVTSYDGKQRNVKLK